MTELLAALAETSPEADEQRSRRLAAAFYEVSKANQQRGWQAELVKETGLTRETIRRYIEDERIRRGEIPPTPRYLKAQARKQTRAARS